MSPKVLDQILPGIPRRADANVLVGFDTSDDAGVYRISETTALVQTVDFFTPIVDEPALFGAIAAANSLSDVYAMGGRPISALSILAYPAKGDLEDLADIVRGGAEKIVEAECSLIGGHSINDDEIKFGYAVTGVVHPEQVKTNAGARPGDVLVLTKPIGTGVISTALKRGIVDPAHLAGSIESMLLLNKDACEAMLSVESHGCTDITGFGLIGHAREMALASGVTLTIEAGRVPLLAGALAYAEAGAIPGGLKNNFAFASCDVEDASSAVDALKNLLYDPQTSGGLLISLPERAAGALIARLPGAALIGRVLQRGTTTIRIE